MIRACLDQLLIVIRSFTLLCDHSRSKTRLIVIMNLIAELGITYATACHASLYRTAWVSESLPPHSAYYYYRNTVWHGAGEIGIRDSVTPAAGALGLCKVLCWLPLIASRNTHFLSLTRRPTNQHPHWCHIAGTVAYLSSLAYCATLGGAIDHNHWSWSAVDDVTIIDHFV